MGAALRLGLLMLPAVACLATAVGVLFLGALEPPVRWVTVLLIGWTGLVNLPSLTAMNLMQAHRDLSSLAVYNLLFGAVTLTVVLALLAAGQLTIVGVAIGLAAGRLATAIYGAWRVAWPKLRKRGAAEAAAQLRRPGPAGNDQHAGQQSPRPAADRAARRSAFARPLRGRRRHQLPADRAGQLGRRRGLLVDHPRRPPRPPAAASTAIRRGLLVAAISAAALAAVAPLLVPFIYGSPFRPRSRRRSCCWSAASPGGDRSSPASAGNALGFPGFGSIGELAGLVVTVVGLAAFVPLFGIVGAASVSLVAYSVRFATTMILLRRRGVRGIFPGLDDFRWLLRSSSRVLAASARRFS